MAVNPRDIATAIGGDWVDGPYYDDAERTIDRIWETLLWPIIRDADYSSVLEIAPGHGRNTAKLLHHAAHVWAVDINQTNVDFITARFANERRLNVIKNDGVAIPEIADATISFVYCFDSMVHFDSDVVRSYIREFRRVMKPGARGFCHYSAYDGNPTGSYRDHPGWRNFMSRALFEHWLAKEGFAIRSSVYVRAQQAIVETADEADVFTYFELPSERLARA